MLHFFSFAQQRPTKYSPNLFSMHTTINLENNEDQEQNNLSVEHETGIHIPLVEQL